LDQHEDSTFLGHGKIVLLEKIRDLDSISAAAKSMGMGYRKHSDAGSYFEYYYLPEISKFQLKNYKLT